MQTLFSNTTGASNTANGALSLYSNITGMNNTASGASAMYYNDTGSDNVAHGARALFSNTTGDANTATGAYALQNNVTGGYNTANGHNAMILNNEGLYNSAFGASALGGNTTGNLNTAAGVSALAFNTTGVANTAAGVQALLYNGSGGNNTALGYQALQNSTGDQNIAVGQGAGSALTSGNKNIYLGHPGVSTESKTMRLGNGQKKTYIAGVNTAAVTGSTVVIDAAGRLGTQLSSARYKQDIAPMGTSSARVLELRPVTFAYSADAQGTRQYGLIAEEVAQVYPELVTRTADGQVQAVRYQELIPMLVNELQRLHEVAARQHQTIEQQARELAELRETFRGIVGVAAAQQ